MLKGSGIDNLSVKSAGTAPAPTNFSHTGYAGLAIDSWEPQH